MSVEFDKFYKKLKKYLCSYNELGLGKKQIDIFSKCFTDNVVEFEDYSYPSLLETIDVKPTPIPSFGKKFFKHFINIDFSYYQIDIAFSLSFIKKRTNYDCRIICDREKCQDDNPLLFDYREFNFDLFMKKIKQNRNSDELTLFIENRFSENDVIFTFDDLERFLTSTYFVFEKFNEKCQRKEKEVNWQEAIETSKGSLRQFFYFPFGLPSALLIQDYLLQKRQESFSQENIKFNRFDNIIAITGKKENLLKIEEEINSLPQNYKKMIINDSLEKEYDLISKCVEEGDFEKIETLVSSTDFLIQNNRCWSIIDNLYQGKDSQTYFRKKIKNIYEKAKCVGFDIKEAELDRSNKVFAPFYNLTLTQIINLISKYDRNHQVNYDDVPIEYCYLFESFSECTIDSSAYISKKNYQTPSLLDNSYSLFERINGYSFSPSQRLKSEIVVDCDIINGSNVFYSKLYKYSYCNSERLNIDTLKVSVANIRMPIKELELDEKQQHFRMDSAYSEDSIINIIIESSSKGAKFVVFPEFCIPFDSIPAILNCCMRVGISLISGVMHHFVDSNKAINYTFVYDNTACFVSLKPKNYYPYEEKSELAKLHKAPKVFDPYYIVYNFSNFVYSSMTCFEATNIRDRGFLNNKINLLFMPVYNKDTTYFSSIVSSTARDLSCFVVQANNSEYGDSRISQPAHSYKTELVQTRGGDNNYFVIGTINLHKMRESHRKMNSIETLIGEYAIDNNRNDFNDTTGKEIKRIKEECENKPLSAGSTIEHRINSGIE